MSEPRFTTKAGRLTPYALACGYLERATFGEDGATVLTLMYDEPCYHVRAHDHDNHERIFWDTFEKLGDARKRYDRAKRELPRR